MGRLVDTVICMCLLARVGVVNSVMSRSEVLEYRERARHMFQHAYDAYMKHGYPYDEVKPRSCTGFNTWGNFSLTLVDSLDTLIIMGNTSEFQNAYNRVIEALNFDVDFVTSVFESNIRVLGGLLSAHLLLHRTSVKLDPGWPCSGRLLDLAVDLADRLLPAFDTPTKMPYGSINLRHGVPPGETTITCAAGVGTFVMEFGVLSRLTGDMRYENAALAAMEALHNARLRTGLIQSHVDVKTGKFTIRESSIGSGMDSYFEYMLKGGILLHNRHLLDMFSDHYKVIRQYLLRNDWYIVGDAETGNGIAAFYQSLESFFPGLQTLMGDVEEASRTAFLYTTVWRRFGSVPEMFDLSSFVPRASHPQYPLRPELVESLMYLHRATQDPYWLEAGRIMLDSIESITKAPCGYCTILNVSQHDLEDRMHSYFLSETVKYLYLLFDQDNFIFNDLDMNASAVHQVSSWTAMTPGCQIGVGGYIFSTEAHPFNIGTLGCCFAAKPQKTSADKETGGEQSVWMHGAEQLVDDDDDSNWPVDEETVDSEEEEEGESGSDKVPVPSYKPSSDSNQALFNVLDQAGGTAKNKATADQDIASALEDVLKQLTDHLAGSKVSPDKQNMAGEENTKLLFDSSNVHVLGLNQPLPQQGNVMQLDQLGQVFSGALDSSAFNQMFKAATSEINKQLWGVSPLLHRVKLINQSIAADKAKDMKIVQDAISETEQYLVSVLSHEDADLDMDDVNGARDIELIGHAANMIAQAEMLLAEKRSGDNEAHRQFIDPSIPFENDFFAADEYTTSPPGLRRRIEVFGGTLLPQTSVT